MKEAEMYPAIKAWLEERNYDVYTEVISPVNGYRADVVAVNGPAVAVVEMKLTLTIEVLAQAYRWVPYANYVYIAVRHSGNRRISDYVANLLKREGIGLIEVVFPNKSSWRQPHIIMHSVAKGTFHRRVDDHLRQTVTPKHKDLPGGHHGGGYVTTYSTTIDRVKDYLRYKAQGKWATLDAILNYCETHWAAPRSSLVHALRNYEADWCETKKEGRTVYFRVKPLEERG